MIEFNVENVVENVFINNEDNFSLIFIIILKFIIEYIK